MNAKPQAQTSMAKKGELKTWVNLNHIVRYRSISDDCILQFIKLEKPKATVSSEV